MILTGKTAVVTGSTSGIGLGIAETLAAAGSQVMLNGFGDLTTIETICRRLAEQHATQVAYSPADMSKPAEIRQLITEAEHKLGPVDILVNRLVSSMWPRSRSSQMTNRMQSFPSIYRPRFTPPRRHCPE